MAKAESTPEPAPDDRTDTDGGGSPPARSGGRPARHRGRLYRRLHSNPVLGLTTKIVVTTLGLVVLAGGVVMMVTPGPGIVLIIVGLAILAFEYERAHHWLVKAREKAQEAKERAENMDPRVRRRRILLLALAAAVVAGLVALYVALYDWPGFAVIGWNWVQGLAAWVPELPGM